MSSAPATVALSTLAQPPLSVEPFAQIARLAEGLDSAGLWWLSGYAAGLARAQGGLVPLAPVAGQADAAAQPRERLTVVYGSQTGNAKRLAEALAAKFEAEGLPVRLLRADAYPTRELKDEHYLAIVISTQGDGDPPDDARALVEFLDGKRAPKLPSLRYTVLGLGDSSYPQFCAIGQRIDARLEALGAQRWVARADADLDIDTVATPWVAQVLAEGKEALKARSAPLATVTPLRPHLAAPVAWTRERPFVAELLTNQRITGRGSDKDIRHIELSLEGAGLDYEPGDALGVVIENPPALVEAIVAELGLDAAAPVTMGTDTLPLRDWLGKRREITRLSRPFVATHAAHAGSDALNRLLAPDQREALTALMADAQIIDLLHDHPGAWTAEALVEALRPLQPRLYSIASSRKAVGDEAHLTVAHVEYARGDATRWGAASHFLAAREEGAQVQVYIEHNERFRLPADGAKDIIMIGPGTGVAPFRAFVQEREAVAATGRNWLFFGNPHAREDFLYQVEWQDALKRGALHRLDLAFSRDQASKVYVQHRLREQARELYAWLENGAHLYVCGDATRMSKDVHAALLDIIAVQGGKSAEDANDYLNTLQTQGRYARDVY
ncbi:assimilatory sulfite reductase (NADPH) flavoprotein subunit [Lysobacter brunescens]|uniref:Sulfite reductase [NADPH] flavoprotein alpha-component n=1 Tax=Lysobacter brunescens TaxID=262323 RepID=A0ABW2YCZ9_9GAMM